MNSKLFHHLEELSQPSICNDHFCLDVDFVAHTTCTLLCIFCLPFAWRTFVQPLDFSFFLYSILSIWGFSPCPLLPPSPFLPTSLSPVFYNNTVLQPHDIVNGFSVVLALSILNFSGWINLQSHQQWRKGSFLPTSLCRCYWKISKCSPFSLELGSKNKLSMILKATKDLRIKEGLLQSCFCSVL